MLAGQNAVFIVQEPDLQAQLPDQLTSLLARNCNVTLVCETAPKKVGFSENVKTLVPPKSMLSWLTGEQRFSVSSQKVVTDASNTATISYGDCDYAKVQILNYCETLRKGLRPDPLHKNGISQDEIFAKTKYELIITPSNIAKRELISRYHLDPAIVATLYPSFKKEVYNTKERVLQRQALRTRHGVNDDEFLIGFFAEGDLHTGGIDIALQTLARLPKNAKFLINHSVTDIGEFSSMLETLSLVDRVRFSRNEGFMHSFYFALDAFYSPSRFHEFGSHALYAMASGLPVLISNKQGAAEVIPAKQLIKSPEDIEGWIDGFMELMKNNEWNTALSRQNAERALALEQSQYQLRFYELLQKNGFLK